MSAEALNVAVLGAGGTIAPAIVRDLAESEETAELMLLDLDEERAAAVAKRHGGDKASARAVDARAGLDDALAGSDVLVNSASYRINLDAMHACLRAGCHYVDLGGLYRMTARQLELHDEFREAGLLGLLGMGSSPGKTNVMGVRALQELGTDSARRVDVVAAGRDLDPPDGFSAPYAVRTLIDELTIPPVVVRDGEPVEVEPLTPGGTVSLPEPIGEAETIFTLHSEELTFPDSFGCSESSFRLSLAPALLERLRELTEAPEEEVERVAREAVPPSPSTVSVHMIEAEEGSRTVRVIALTEGIAEWELGGGIISTAAPAAAAVRLLARGRIDARGVMPAEACVAPDALFPELERRSCTFTIEEAVAG